MLALGAVAVGDDAAEDAREHLPADEEPEAEVHVRGGDAAERAQHQQRHRPEQEVVARALRAPGESDARRLLPHRAPPGALAADRRRRAGNSRRAR